MTSSMNARAGSLNNRNQVAPSLTSSPSLAQRSLSLIRNNPDMAWLSVADASTTEEAMEVGVMCQAVPSEYQHTDSSTLHNGKS